MQQVSPPLMVEGAPPRAALESIDSQLQQVLRSKVIGGLDALRALAVSLVLADHFLLADHLVGIHPKTGSLGVMIFFVLSGFLITGVLLREYRKTGGISLSNFYRRRAFRIFPTFYCCWILTTVVDLLAHQMQWKTAAFSFFYLMDYARAFAPDNVQPWMHMWISWSLAVEEKFYLLWPLLLLILLKRPHLQRNLAAIILGQWTYRALLVLLFHASDSYLYCAFDMRADALLIGCLLAVVVENEWSRRLSCYLLRWQALSLIAPAVLVWVLLVPCVHPVAHLLVWSLEPVIVAVMLLQFVYWGAQSWKVCGSRPVRVLAQLSYALYLYHPLAGKIVKLLDLQHLGLYAALLMLGLATASYYLVEKPFMRLRDRPLPGALFQTPPAQPPGRVPQVERALRGPRKQGEALPMI